MHYEVLDFVNRTRARFPEYFQNKKVLEFGSLNINGSVRQLFENCEYIGVDKLSGKDVDCVCLCHEYKSDTKFDVIISTEMLEHDQHADKTIANMIRLLADTGIVIITCANTNREKHLEELNDDGYYGNIDRDCVEKWIKLHQLAGIIEEDQKRQDIRFILVKNEGIFKNHPELPQVKSIYSREKIVNTMRAITAEADFVKPYVCICQPRRDLRETPSQKLDGYEGLHVDVLGFSHGFCEIGGEKVDVARNYLFEKALESGAKYMLFVGEDTVLPWDGFVKLHETAEKNPGSAVVGVYYIKCSSAMVMRMDGEYIFPANVDPGQPPFEIHQAGMDAMLLPMSMVKSIKENDPEIPFCCIAHPSIPGLEDLPFVGEDNFFYFRLRQCGFKVLCNPQVQCLHMDLKSGKYTAHPSITPEIIKQNYYTNIPITTPLTMADKAEIDKRWIDRLPKSKLKGEKS